MAGKVHSLASGNRWLVLHFIDALPRLGAASRAGGRALLFSL
jgi:hypothetical protein